MTEIGVALGALVAGALFGWLVGRGRTVGRAMEQAAEVERQLGETQRRLGEAEGRAGELAARLDERRERLATLERELAGAKESAERARADLVTAREAGARLQAELAGEREGAAEKLKLLGEAEQRLTQAFQALSAEALHANSASFLNLAKESLQRFQTGAVTDLASRQQAINELVAPIRDSLQKVGTKLDEVEKDRIGARAQLDEQLRRLASSQDQLRSETGNLVKALRTPTVRGQWGEIQLKRVVEVAGMLAHCDFQEQETVTTEDGRLRPDLMINLPGGRVMVVDAKAPLLSYLDALECEDDGARAERLRDHARQVRDHVTRLGAKAYWEQLPNTPECVVMFLPGETVFSAALQHDPTLIEFAAGKRVVLASPITLIALLFAIAKGWQQEQLAANTRTIWRLGQELHDRLRVTVGHFDNLRRALDGAVDAYNRAMGSLESRVLVSARRLKELGAGGQEDIGVLDTVERTARELQADQLAMLPDDDDGEDGETARAPERERAATLPMEPMVEERSAGAERGGRRRGGRSRPRA